MLTLNSDVAYTGDKKNLPGYWAVFGYDPLIALGLRKLNSEWEGAAINVRRSSDSTTADIGFTSDGLLDTDALLAFCGTGNGFVKIWYDQSGNGFNASRDADAGQPQIVANGALLTMNYKPSMKFDGVDDALTLAPSMPSVLGSTYLASSIVAAFETAPTAAATLLNYYFYDNAAATPFIRRYSTALGYNSADKNKLQIMTNQQNSGSSVISTTTDTFGLSEHLFATSYLDMESQTQGINLNQGTTATAAVAGTSVGSLTAALIGGGRWSGNTVVDPVSCKMCEFILLNEKSQYFLSNIVSNQKKYFLS